MKHLAASLSFFTRLPVPAAAEADPRWVVALAPAVGALLGLASGAVLAVCTAALDGPYAALVGGFAAVAFSAYLTRGLHWDGLADLADGLGSRLPGPRALVVMQRPETGAFGVLSVVLVVGLQASLLAALAGSAWVAVIVAMACGRLAPVLLCRRGVPAAPGSALGAWVAGRIGPATALAITGAVAAACAALVAAAGAAAPGWGAAAVLAPIATALWLGRLSARRLGGITGDVLGAGVELSTTAALLLLAVGA